MHKRSITSDDISQLFPPRQRDALVMAARMRDWQAIDRITDELARMGLVRPRDAMALPSASQQAAAAAARRGL